MRKSLQSAPGRISTVALWATVGPANRRGNRYVDYGSLSYARSEAIIQHLRGSPYSWQEMQARGWTVEKVTLLAGWGEP